MSSFLLIHGAWHGGWCWGRIVARLQAQGHRVLAPDLPGHGASVLAAAEATLDRYADFVAGLLEDEAEPVLLVGHSMGGAVIGAAAERCPERLRALVYVTAFLLRNGESIADVTRDETESVARRNGIVSPDRLTIATRPEAVTEAFYGECAPEDAAFAAARLGPQARQPFVAKAAVSAARFGRVPRFYVECRRDRAITPACQRRMQAALPCVRTFSLDTDHSPFFSAPGALADALLAIDAATGPRG